MHEYIKYLGLTETVRHFAAPVGCGSIAAREGGGTLELVSTEAVEIGFSLRMQTGDRHVPICWSIREVATQHKCCNGEKTNNWLGKWLKLQHATPHLFKRTSEAAPRLSLDWD